MSFPRYERYKDSGVEWLGEVPEHWSVTALKRGFSVTLGKMLQPESSSPEDELLPYLRAANIQWKGVDITDIKQMWMSKRDRNQLQLEKGDLLVSEGGDVGRSCLWAAELEDCYFQNSLNRVRSRDGHSNRYLYYWISTIKDKGYIDVLCNKSTIAHFTAEKVAAVPVPFPSPTEQIAISAFLDRETTKIDELIAEQQRLIELLKEKRQAVISHAVTKGLNPDVTMKDSGVEWLGEIPQNWCDLPLKAVVSYNDEVLDEGTSDDTEILYVDISSVDAITGVSSKESMLFSSAPSRARRRVKHGDVIVSTVRTYLRAIARILEPEENLIVSTGFCVVRPSGRVIHGFLGYILSSNYFIEAVISHSVGVSYPAINASDLVKIKIPLPSIPEQKSISAFIDREIAKLDTLTGEAQRVIELLKERRTALISAAVTGKIDVRVSFEKGST